MTQISEKAVRYTQRLFLFAVVSAPLFASAVFEFYDPLHPKPTGAPKIVTLASSVNVVIGLINRVIPFLIGVAFVLVLAGILKYVAAGGDNEKIAEGRRVIIWGGLILFVMLSFWGLVTVVCTSLFGQCPPPAL